MKRYVIGALYGAIAFGVTYMLLIVGVEAWRGRMIRFRSLADLVLARSVINVLVLVAIQGPLLLVIRRISRGVGPLAPAALVAIGLAPMGTFAAWLMFRESNETILGLLLYIRNVPGEFALNLIPNIVGAALFSMWVLSADEPHPAQSLEPKA